MNFEDSQILLNEVNKIYNKMPIKEKTFMEVSGYPHYENVCSNILAFYLNPKEEHKLGSVLINSMLNVVCNKEKNIYKDINLSHFNIYREYTTLNGNRIDIVMQNEELVIGIENKIYASVYNDLEDYAKTLNKLNKNSIKILLSLHKEIKNITRYDFINITYSEFFKQLKQDLKSYNQVDNKWYIYLIDFINNIEGFEVEKDMELEIINWINGHKKEIKEFKELLNIAQDNIKKKLEEYVRIFNEKLPEKYNIKYYNGEDEISTTAYIVFDGGYNFDTKLDTENWKLGIFIWKKSSQLKIKEILNKNNIKYIEENSHLWLYEFNYDTLVEDIVSKSIDIYKMIA